MAQAPVIALPNQAGQVLPGGNAPAGAANSSEARLFQATNALETVKNRIEERLMNGEVNDSEAAALQSRLQRLNKRIQLVIQNDLNIAAFFYKIADFIAELFGFRVLR